MKASASVHMPGEGDYTALCRDCFYLFDGPGTTLLRCQRCFGTRVVAHEELMALAIAHVDCDAFYASVEKRDNPDLRGKPVIVGGGTRGVVTTACYQARIAGVHSAMPMFKARKACPEAIIIRPNMKKYVTVSRQIRTRMRRLTPLVQAVSIDEAYLDLSGTTRLHGAPPAVLLARLARDIETDIGITISIGLSTNRFLAKCASDLDKPRGFSVIGAGEAQDFLHDKPIRFIGGVGKAMQKMLRRDNLHTIGQLQALDARDLARRYGAMGVLLAKRARGIDNSRVTPNRGAKSISCETTLGRDIASEALLRRRLRALSERVSHRLKRNHLGGQSVTLKLKTASFQTLTRSRKLNAPTQLADRIFHEAADLLRREIRGTAYRLIGVGVSDLCAERFADPDDLIEQERHKRRRAEEAMDRVRERFGWEAVKTGLTFDNKRV